MRKTLFKRTKSRVAFPLVLIIRIGPTFLTRLKLRIGAPSRLLYLAAPNQSPTAPIRMRSFSPGLTSLVIILAEYFPMAGLSNPRG